MLKGANLKGGAPQRPLLTSRHWSLHQMLYIENKTMQMSLYSVSLQKKTVLYVKPILPTYKLYTQMKCGNYYSKSHLVGHLNHR